MIGGGTSPLLGAQLRQRHRLPAFGLALDLRLLANDGVRHRHACLAPCSTRATSWGPTLRSSCAGQIHLRRFMGASSATSRFLTYTFAGSLSSFAGPAGFVPAQQSSFFFNGIGFTSLPANFGHRFPADVLVIGASIGGNQANVILPFFRPTTPAQQLFAMGAL